MCRARGGPVVTGRACGAGWRHAPGDQRRRDRTKGNVATAREAAALQRYTLLNRATILTLGGDLGLAALLEGDPLLPNVISVLLVNPATVPGVRGDAAVQVITWLPGDEAQRLISEFGVEQFGQPLFFPRTPGWSRTPTALTGRQPLGP